MPKLPCNFDFVHLEFSSAHRQGALDALSQIASRIPAARRRLIVVDNAGAPSPLSEMAPFDEIILLRGDNSSREFSGWDVAASWLRRGAASATDGYVFSNDTIVRHRRFGAGRKRCFAKALARLPQFREPVICGEIDGLLAPVSMPWGVHAFYASTYLFGLNRIGFESLTPFCALDDQIAELLVQSWPTESLFTDAVPPSYSDRLSRWLHQPGGWYAAAPLSADNFVAMKTKARMILLEQSLSARVGTIDGQIISIYQGSTKMDRALGALADRYERRWRVPTRLQKLKQLAAVARERSIQ